jgi:hypothetical protein
VYLLVSPVTAGPGATVIVRGYNFPRRRRATVTIGGQPLPAVTTNSIGNFATGWFVGPGTPAGVRRLEARVAHRSASAPVRIAAGRVPQRAVTTASTGATLSTSSVSGPPGERLRIAARGLPPRQPVWLGFAGRRVAAGRSGAGGGYARTVRVPNLGVGRREVALAAGRLVMKSYFDIRPAHPRRRPGGAVTLAAAGDIACQPGEPQTSFQCRERDTARLLAYLNPTAVAPLGDNQLDAGALPAYIGSFDATWGLFKGRMHPAAGNHEYLTPGAAGHFAYFGLAAAPPHGYYAYDIGAWHVVVLNSNCKFVACGPGSPQERWLRANLASARHRCTLAYFHHPRFTSAGRHVTPTLLGLWSALYDHGVEVVLNGHAHVYERFAPQNPYGTADPRGVRQFTVGTGGNGIGRFVTARRNSEMRLRRFGVLELILRPGSYGWRFVTTPAGLTRDRGSGGCH